MTVPPEPSLQIFHPVIREWFAESIGTPTDIQAKAWPEIASGRHVLVTAPTGSGKTLTAFLWALDRLLTGAWEAGRTRVLYVSPLKALNSDVERNLERPLAELSARFAAAGLADPGIRTLVRSGDTPQKERRRMITQPPEILITTPESLNILLTSKGGRGILDGLETVILDEIHAVAGSKRGIHLITAVDRLVLLSGELQRIALSATVKPLARIAELVGGSELVGEEGSYVYQRRPVVTLQSAAEKRYEVRVRYPAAAKQGVAQLGAAKLGAVDTDPDLPAPPPDTTRATEEASYWELAVPELTEVIAGNRSTLLFTNSRRLTEKLTRLINEEHREPLAYSHHGSLSKEVRSVVENRLKAGELAALVATSSLELGIDIGDLEEVILIQTPPTVASAVQRIGRAGHRVGEVSRGTLYPTHGRDFLDAAVTARAVVEGDIEEIRPVENPLDVLAQVILSMTVAEEWHLDDLYAFIRSTDPYRTLSRRSFDLVIEMLAGRYADSRVRELKPRLAVDRVQGIAKARSGVDRLLYMSGGTIPDRGYFHLRLKDSMARLGELDEEFVWERSIGDTFTLGAQGWRIVSITHNDVLVVPARGGTAMPPFWRADERDRGYHLSERVGRFLSWIEPRLSSASLPGELEEHYHVEPPAIRELLELLRAQKTSTGVLPHRHRLLVERTGGSERESEGRQRVILHTFWGGKVNRPFSLALAAALEERYPTSPVEVIQDNDCILLAVPPELSLSAAEIFSMVEPDAVEILLRRRLETTGFFGARFRENASRALLLPRAGFRHRTPLWLNRQRSKRLLEAVAKYGDFPIVVETWRTCLQDEFDLPALKDLLGEIKEGKIRLSEVTTSTPSPFADQLIWRLTNTAMYEDDTPHGTRRGAGGLRHDVLRELVLSSALRPRLGGALIDEFRRKVQRVWPGYAPRDGGELVEWVKERLLIPRGEWEELLQAVGELAEEDWQQVRERLVWLRPVSLRQAGDADVPRESAALEGTELLGVAALDVLPRIARSLALGPDQLGLAPLSGPPGTPLGGQLSPAAQEAVTALFAQEASARELAGDDEEEDLFPELLGEWIRFYGPFEPGLPRRLFGVSRERLEEAYESLVEAQTLVLDVLRKGSGDVEACDTENLEILLRWSRAAARPSFEARPLTELPLFLAHHQGLTAPGESVEDLRSRLEQLLGFPAPARLWEGELLPARLRPYYPAWLDSLYQESELQWLGVGSEKVTFAFPNDLELLLPTPQEADPELAAALAVDVQAARELFPDPRGRFELTTLMRHAGLSRRDLGARLWDLAWKGRVTTDSFAVLRRGIQARFKPGVEPTRSARATSSARSGRRRFQRWKSDHEQAGAWALLEPPPPAEDALEAIELAAERARLLLGRYGIVFRELLARELPAFAWSEIFRALRRMELSGEVLSGYFFEGIYGPQFISHAAFRLLKEGLPNDAAYWLSALDPASPCGLDLMDLKGLFPRRHATTHIAFIGPRPVLVSTRGGKELTIELPPDHPRLPEALVVLETLLTRGSHPLASIEVDTINGEPAQSSPYRPALEERFGVTGDANGVRLWKRY